MVVDILDQSATGHFVLFIGERRRGHALELVGQGVALVVEIGIERLQDRAVDPSRQKMNPRLIASKSLI